MILNGSTYSQSVCSCIFILNWGLLINVLSIRISICLWNCWTQFGNSRCLSLIYTYQAFTNRRLTFQQNYSFSGEFNTLTKLIFCLVMIRGRHRGLPAAIDRAVMLPAQLQITDDLIRENRSQHSIDEAARGASTPPINTSMRAYSIRQRVRTTSRGFSATSNAWCFGEWTKLERWNRRSDSLKNKCNGSFYILYYGHGLVATAYTSITSSACYLSYQLTVMSSQHLSPQNSLNYQNDYRSVAIPPWLYRAIITSRKYISYSALSFTIKIHFKKICLEGVFG